MTKKKSEIEKLGNKVISLLLTLSFMGQLYITKSCIFLLAKITSTKNILKLFLKV